MLPDLELIIKTVGMLGVWAIVFAESGLLIGFFLPGDSLLVTSGFLAAQGHFNLYILAIGCFIAAVLGDNVGYTFGHRYGKRLFERKNSTFFNKDNLIKAQQFYQKHGKKTIIIARFVPIVRTFAPIVAGISDMEYKTFVTYNLIGGFLWAVGLTIVGYFIGQTFGDYIEVVILLIIAISLLPTFYHVLKDPNNRKQLIQMYHIALRKVTSK